MVSDKRAGALLIIGGREDREGDRVILEEFVRLAGGSEARIVVMPVASQEPDAMGKMYCELFGSSGVQEARVVNVTCREDAYAAEAIRLIENATGVFFTGGSQTRITALLGGSPVDHLLSKRAEDGLVIGGTSAGASVMSDTMILRASGEGNPRVGGVELGSGLGYIRGLLIDQHFAERGRIYRLISAVAQHPRYLGVGIDEDTAIVVEEQHFRVIGSGSVTVADGSNVSYSNFASVADHEPIALENVVISILPPGYGFDLSTRRLCTPEDMASSAKAGERRAKRDK